MQEPKIHSAIDPILPDDHWILHQHMAEHPDVAVDGEPDFPPGTITCETRGEVIYTKEQGTVRTWVETGRIVDRHGHEEPYTVCLKCFADRTSAYPVMDPMFAFNDDGTPQPYDGN